MSSSQSPAIASNDVAIKFDHVTKTYKLYKDDRQRFASIFWSAKKRDSVTTIDANNDLSFEIKKGEAVAFLGGTPVFADCGTSSFNMDAESLGRCISSRTKAVIPVHLFGRPCDMKAITAIAENAGITVIEDNAQSLGAVCDCSIGVLSHA